MSPLLDRSAIPFVPALGENDLLNDCTVVALVNSARAASWIKDGRDLAIDWSAVVATFAEIANVPATMTAEKAVAGLDPKAVLNYAMSRGIDAGLQAPLVLQSALAVVPVPTAIYAAMQPGAAYLEIGLTADDEASAACMDAVTGAVVARHQVIAWNCTGLAANDAVQIGTWGRWQYMTWRGLQARVVGVWQLHWDIP